MSINHSLVSAVVDDGVSGEISPIDWNDGHKGTITDFYVVNETPSGTIDGANATFTLAGTPVSGTLQLYRNGMLQQEGVGNDFTISGLTITMLTGSIPNTGNWLMASYLATVT